MHEERQKKWVFDQVNGINCDTRPLQKSSGVTPTSHNKTGGATSSTLAKLVSNTISCNAGSGRWTTYKGPGQPMDIGKLRSEGRCFRCKEKGHLSKDCPKKQDYRDICSVSVPTEAPLSMDSSKVEENLHTGAYLSSAGWSHSSSLGTIVLYMHSNIPASISPAFNVPSTTSAPVPESQNRYTALQVESMDDDDNETTSSIRPQDEGRDTGDIAATMGESSRQDASGPLKSKKLSPPSSGPVWEILKGLSQPPARAQAKAAESTGHRAESPSRKTKADQDSTESDLRAGSATERFPVVSTTAGKASCKNVSYGAMWANPVALSEGDALVQIDHLSSATPPGNTDGATTRMEATTDTNQRTGDTLTRCQAMVMKELQGGSASIQAVERGHSVTMIKVPDEEDDTVYQIWLAKKTWKDLPNRGVMTSIPNLMPTTEPPRVDWTLQVIREVLSDTVARATLFLWVHKDRTGEVMNEVLDLIRKGGETARKTLYELQEPIRYVQGSCSQGHDLMLDIQLEPCTGTKALIT
ncbi:uncharacterized protein ARMOST_02929 [Armillaria ostoyae]|uniref:CCHC-type domain-containing protein n=1 Tax=Armillaria ostoyae TaxID=47428 RepID=A0A284QT98_ARMOS|nr:uncharacterized protein ARMOST_02929 [Armillaria ostoyae]